MELSSLPETAVSGICERHFITGISTAHHRIGRVDATAFVLNELYGDYHSRRHPLQQITYVMIAALQYVASDPQERYDREQLLGVMGRMYSLCEAEPPMNPYLVSRASALIEQRFEDITLEQLARELGMSRAYLSHVISASAGCTFRDLLLCRRILAFMERYFFSQNETLEHAALCIGFTSIHYFSRIFKSFTGVTPCQVRKGLASLVAEQEDFRGIHIMN